MSQDIDWVQKRDKFFEDVIKKTRPDASIHFKEDGYKAAPWWAKVAVFGIKRLLYPLLRQLSKGFDKDFDTDYVTIFGPQIWFPSREKFDDPKRAESTLTVLRHEHIHMLDAQRYRSWFYVSYLLILPGVWTMRAWWEYRGYAQNLIAAFERDGEIKQAQVDWIINIFKSGGYFFMDPFRAEKRVKWLVQEIEAGRLKGHDARPKVPFNPKEKP